jgi:cell division protein FtsL
VKSRQGIRNWRRKVTAALTLAVLVASLGISVSRSAQGTRIAAELADLQREERALEAQAVEEWIRVDSLESRERVLESARQLGLRPSLEGEILYLPDVTAPSSAGSAGQ